MMPTRVVAILGFLMCTAACARPVAGSRQLLQAAEAQPGSPPEGNGTLAQLDLELAAALRGCPHTSGNLGCVGADYPLPSLSWLLGYGAGPLRLLGHGNGSVDLLRLLPYRDMMRRLSERAPQWMHQCGGVPAMRGAEVRAPAAAAAPGLSDLLSACRNAPFPVQNNFIFGAYTSWDSGDPVHPRGGNLPGLRAMWRDHWAAAPRAACLAFSPCTWNVYLGLQGIRRHVQLEGPLSSIAIRPASLFYSHFASVAPPAWRQLGGQPNHWILARPDVLGAPGARVPVSALTTTSGRLWLAGSIAFGSFDLGNGTRLGLGPQSSAWVLQRGPGFAAVSLRLAAAPSLRLWDAITLPLREVPGLDRGAVDLTMRPPSAALWLSAQQLSLPAHALATRVPAFGAALARVFADTWREEANAWDVKGLDVHGTAAGVAVRLQLLAADLDGKDAYRLTPAAQAVVRADAIPPGQEATLVMYAPAGASSFGRLTLLAFGRAYPMVPCAKDADCPTGGPFGPYPRSTGSTCVEQHAVCAPVFV